MTSLQAAITDLEKVRVGSRVCVRYNDCNKVGTVSKMWSQYVSIEFDDMLFNADIERYGINMFRKECVRPMLSLSKVAKVLCLQNYTFRDVMKFKETGVMPERRNLCGGRSVRPFLCGNRRESSSVFRGLPESVWGYGVFSFLSPNEVSCFGSLSQGTCRLVESVRVASSGGNLWSTGQFCIVKEDYGKGERIAYEGPYIEWFEAGEDVGQSLREREVYNVYRTRTIRFLIKMMKRKELYEVHFRSGLLMYTEDTSGIRYNESHQSEVHRWVDCSILKRIQLSSGQYESFVMFETMPFRDPTRDWLRTGFRLHNGIWRKAREVDVGLCGSIDCAKCTEEKLGDGHLQNMSVVSECNLRWCLGMYTTCALRLDSLPHRVTRSFPKAGAILRELPPLLLNRYVVDSVVSGRVEIVCGREPLVRPTERFSRIPTPARYRRYRRQDRARRVFRMSDSCYYEHWIEYDFKQLPWYQYCRGYM